MEEVFRATVSGDGRPGPIEQRIGRRLVRCLDPESAEGRRLLDNARVELIGPEGSPLGRISLEQALDRLRQRLEEKLAGAGNETEPPVLAEDRRRLMIRTGTKDDA